MNENSPVWISDLGGEVFSNLVFSDGKIYLLTKVSAGDAGGEKTVRSATKNILWSLDAGTGVTDWRVTVVANDFAFLDIYRNKIFLIGRDGRIAARLKSDGQEVFDKKLEREITSLPNFFENEMYFGTADNSILAVSLVDGEIISTLPALQSPASVLINAREGIFWGERKGSVKALEPSLKRKLWNVRFGGEISSLTFVSDGILVSSLDNFVHLISLSRGEKIWKRRLAGRIAAKPLIDGNFAVFVSAADDNAVVLDLRDGKIVNQISLANRGYLLSAPLIVDNLLVFLTTKGIFAYAAANANCSQNQIEEQGVFLTKQPSPSL